MIPLSVTPTQTLQGTLSFTVTICEVLSIVSFMQSAFPPAARRQFGHLSASSCAGIEYLDVLSGHVDFSLYRTTKPWDHAAGTLMLGEAGGNSMRFDGQPYAPAQPINAGLIAAAHPQTLAIVRTLFEAVRLPLLAGLPRA